MGNKNTEKVNAWRRRYPQKRKLQVLRYKAKHAEELKLKARIRGRNRTKEQIEAQKKRAKSVYCRNASRINEFKSSGCVLCGETDIRCLDLHHVEPKTKTCSVSMLRSISESKLEDELDKCVVLCANCHRKTHDGNKNTKAHLIQTYNPGRPRIEDNPIC